MEFNSPLTNLSKILMQIQESANVYRQTLITNEAATRAVLIDPVLRSLGWDTANTNMVEVEKVVNNVRADYALYDSNAIVRVIVEAKALGTNLENQNVVMALVNYAFSFNLTDVFLTDGIIWNHFNDFRPGNLSPTRTINLRSDNPVDCAVYFVQHLDVAKYWPLEQSIDILSQRIDELENRIATLQTRVAELTANLQVEPQILQTNQFPLQEEFVLLQDLTELAGRRPALFRLPTGEIKEVNTWKDILRESCKFTLGHNPSIPIPFPDRVGRRVSLFSYERPAHRVSYVTEQYNGRIIYIYLNYDSHNCVANALYVLDKCPDEFKIVPPAIVLRD